MDFHLVNLMKEIYYEFLHSAEDLLLLQERVIPTLTIIQVLLIMFVVVDLLFINAWL